MRKQLSSSACILPTFLTNTFLTSSRSKTAVPDKPGMLIRISRKFADEGKSVLLFTSELREIQLTCDRAIVIYEGKVQADLEREKCTEENLMNAAHGLVVTS